MTLTLTGLIVLIVIAAICGAVGKALAGGAPSIIGAALFVAPLHLLSGRRWVTN